MKNLTRKFCCNYTAAAVLKIETIIVLLIFFLNSISGQNNKDTLIKVSDNVYEIRGFIANIAFLVTDEGVCLFDVGETNDNGKKILHYIKSVTDKPVKYIVITHYHFDHIGGLSEMPSTAKIIGQKNLAGHISDIEKDRENRETVVLPHLIDSLRNIEKETDVKEGKEFQKTDSILNSFLSELEKLKKEKAIYPNILIDSLSTIVLGKDTIDLIYPGKAHTDGDLVVNIRTKKILVLGDLLFNKSWLYIDLSGDVNNWSHQLKTLSAYNVRYFIPGHADLASKEDVLLFSNYLNDLYTSVENYKEQGKTIEEIKTLIKLPLYDEYGFKYSRDMNIDAIFNQLSKVK